MHIKVCEISFLCDDESVEACLLAAPEGEIARLACQRGVEGLDKAFSPPVVLCLEFTVDYDRGGWAWMTIATPFAGLSVARSFGRGALSGQYGHCPRQHWDSVESVEDRTGGTRRMGAIR